MTGPPAYTVTSPRPSVASPPTASEMSHLVQAAADYKAKKAKSEEWFNVIMMMDCQPAGECLGESVTTSLHHTIIFLGKTFHLGGN